MTASPSGGRRFLSRSLQVFFGHPILYALPAIAIALLGLYVGLSKSDEYRSVGTVSVSSETFLGNLSDVRSTDFRFESAAGATSRQFNELMQTDGFAELVAETAGLRNALASGAIAIPDVRSNVFATATGDTLMSVVALSNDPEVARRLAESSIVTFKNWVTDAEIGASGAAETFFDDLLESYEIEVEAASEELTTYLLDHPAPLDPRDTRDTAEQLEIERLNAQLGRAQERLDSTLDKKEAARQAARESSADIDQRLQVVDAPQAPSQPENGLKQLATNLIMYGILGALVSIAAVAFGCVLNRSILSVSDLDEIGAPVLAVVPRTHEPRAKRKTGSARRKKRAVVEQTPIESQTEPRASIPA